MKNYTHSISNRAFFSARAVLFAGGEKRSHFERYSNNMCIVF